jgi:hypothetical protein
MVWHSNTCERSANDADLTLWKLWEAPLHVHVHVDTSTLGSKAPPLCPYSPWAKLAMKGLCHGQGTV